MPYTPTTWVDGTTKLSATNLNHLETGVDDATATADAAIPAPASIANHETAVYNGSSWVRSTTTKLQYGSLTLTGSIVDADLSASAAVQLAKLEDPGSGKVVTSTGSGAVASYPPGYQYDYVQITSDASITATTEGTANTVITGTATALDGSVVWVEFFCPASTKGTGALTGVLMRGATVLGQFLINDATDSQKSAVYARFRDSPGSGTFTYYVKAFVGGGTGTVSAGAGGTGAKLPAYLRVSKA